MLPGEQRHRCRLPSHGANRDVGDAVPQARTGGRNRAQQMAGNAVVVGHRRPNRLELRDRMVRDKAGVATDEVFGVGSVRQSGRRQDGGRKQRRDHCQGSRPMRLRSSTHQVLSL